MDPVAFRKKNLRDPVYHRQLERGAQEIGWSRRNPDAGGNAGPLKRGMGCAVGIWGGNGNNQCKVDVTVSRDGAVLVAVGTQPAAPPGAAPRVTSATVRSTLSSDDTTICLGSKGAGLAQGIAAPSRPAPAPDRRAEA